MDRCVDRRLYAMTMQTFDDAVGTSNVQKIEWFVTIINNRSEKKYSQVLYKEGCRIFMLSQSEERIICSLIKGLKREIGIYMTINLNWHPD